MRPAGYCNRSTTLQNNLPDRPPQGYRTRSIENPPIPIGWMNDRIGGFVAGFEGAGGAPLRGFTFGDLVVLFDQTDELRSITVTIVALSRCGQFQHVGQARFAFVFRIPQDHAE
jgi:hypothetical protein